MQVKFINITEQQALLILNGHQKLGPVSRRRLMEAFGHEALAVLLATVSNLKQVKGIGPDTAAAINAWDEHFDPVVEQNKMERYGVQFIDAKSDLFPAWLKEIYDPPLGFYLRGQLQAKQRMVGIIGTRRASFYGLKVAKQLASELAQRGFCIVSGLARGIDTAAHQGAVEVGGRTAAILGCGVDIVYPPENVKLYRQIIESGAIISELPFNTPPTRNTFPMRNRLVAGMCEAVIVVESDARGGSMITANLAADYGRQVLAVPGQITQATSRGCHQLIRDGAVLVSSVEDVLEELISQPTQLNFDDALPVAKDSDDGSSTVDYSKLGPDEQAILKAMNCGEPLHQDQIADATGLPIAKVTALLLMLELQKHIGKRADGRFEVA